MKPKDIIYFGNRFSGLEHTSLKEERRYSRCDVNRSFRLKGKNVRVCMPRENRSWMRGKLENRTTKPLNLRGRAEDIGNRACVRRSADYI